ncbi:hypothetical protein Bcav_3459 [Beutenbergia cavernae DSM 12333]|uniref:Uncharacterized protein n=1 Tax=Beutenbergia cavernae (strain ATCC BAA-8 / DSM 12333 / CCUG 43141 / JCM 11478 / NBRC 16432 / NCIMB 13614 / HKI 0122) TaxID=471853 RepID=C5C276_BEUC1|nr:hypothetical protein Bcav_3459 [Beutenbergia cavernae DSM 12333]
MVGAAGIMGFYGWLLWRRLTGRDKRHRGRSNETPPDGP